MADFLGKIPWWGWALFGLAVVVVVPIKLNILKKIMGNRAKKDEAIED